MWPFSPTHESCRRRLRDHADRIETLEASLRHIKLEFNSLHDYVQHVTGRHLKRAARAQDERTDPETGSSGSPPGMDPISLRLIQERSRVPTAAPRAG